MWGVIGSLRGGLIACACEVMLVLVLGVCGSGVGVLDWSWVGLACSGPSGDLPALGLAGFGASGLLVVEG